MSGAISKDERKKCADEKLKAFLYQNLRYPAIAKSTIEGMVVVSFVVEPNGQISNAQVVRDIERGAGNEALKVVQQTNGLRQPY
ncbi:MAG: TonB family protein [Saprospiraceae bacterium]